MSVATTADEEKTALGLEQYKLYVDLTDRAAARRQSASQFHAGVLAALLPAASLTAPLLYAKWLWLVLLVASLVGLAIAASWVLFVWSGRALAKIKWDIVEQMETRLPWQCFTDERARTEATGSGYKPNTHLELIAPVAMAVPYAGVAIIAAARLLCG